MSAQTEIRIGSEFVGYRIDELIGRGGMGVVYRAYDLRLKRTVALKLMAPELALDQRFRERFSREAELAMSLEHPNVVPIHDAGDIDGRLYLAMRHVEGTDLRALLHAEGRSTTARALAICSQVANALDAAHASGLVHRDVKPSNVLLDAGEHVYLADFGLTRRLDEQGGPAGESRSVGTPAYLAPEQIEGGPVDGRTDVYSLGCLLYECLTGEAPFARGSRLAVAWAHLEEEPPSASERRPELPEAIDAVIRKAMAKEPEGRYTTCAALIAAAEEALGLGRPPAFSDEGARCSLPLRPSSLLAGALVAAVLVRGDGNVGVAAPPVKADTLVRIDPATNKVSAVTGVGRRPSAIAAGGRSVWVYNATAGRSRRSTRQQRPSDTRRRSSPHPAIRMPSRARCWPPTPPAPGSSASTSAEGLHLTRVFSGPRGKREYRLQDEPRAVAVGYGAVWVVVRGAARQPGAAHRPGHGRGHEADALPQLLADRRSRRRPWQRLGCGLVQRNALPDQPSLGSRDRTDRPRRTRRPTRGGARLDLGRLVRLGRGHGHRRPSDARLVSTLIAVLRRGATTRCGYGSSGATTRPAGPSCGGTVRPIEAPPTSMSRIRRSTAGCA